MSEWNNTRNDAIRSVKAGILKDRKQRRFQAKLDRTYAEGMRGTDRAIEWDETKWQRICRLIYCSLGIPLVIISVGVLYLAHLLISATYRKRSPILIALSLVAVFASYGVYIPFFILYAVGYGGRG